MSIDSTHRTTAPPCASGISNGVPASGPLAPGLAAPVGGEAGGFGSA